MLAHDGHVDVHLQLCCRTEEAQQALTSTKYVLLSCFVSDVCFAKQVTRQWLQRHSSACCRCAAKSSPGQLRTPGSRLTVTASMLVQHTMLQMVHPGNR